MTEHFEMLKIACGEQKMGSTQLLRGFTSSKAVRPLLKMPKAKYVCQYEKHETVNWVKELVF
jgi:hypothetical protein